MLEWIISFLSVGDGGTAGESRNSATAASGLASVPAGDTPGHVSDLCCTAWQMTLKLTREVSAEHTFSPQSVMILGNFRETLNIKLFQQKNNDTH